MNIKPNRIFPGKVYAFMWGPTLRLEYADNGENYWDARKASRLWKCFGVPATTLIDGRRAVFTHLQKKMKWGIFITTGYKSWGFHLWFHWHMQEFRDENNGIPDSERGIYFRLPGYRWDLEEGMIWTGGRVPGAHFD